MARISAAPVGKEKERLTCRNQLIRTLPSTEPERIAVPREVEDLQLQIGSIVVSHPG
jgi:hypothetical protein